MRYPDLSIVVPTYNESARISRCLVKLQGIISPLEIIVIDNGSTDDTRQIVHSWMSHYRNIRLIELAERGKGAAIRAGMLAAKARYVYMADCDLSVSAETITDFLLFQQIFKVDVVIGSRRLPKSKVVQSFSRKISGSIFHALTRILLPNIQDTQCGFKLFTRQAAQDVFEHVNLTGLAFDVDALLVASQLGYKIVEMPVTWKEDSHSQVRVVRDGLAMAKDVIGLAMRKNDLSPLLSSR